MLHTKFHGNRPTGSGKKILKGFYHMLAWRDNTGQYAVKNKHMNVDITYFSS